MKYSDIELDILKKYGKAGLKKYNDSKRKKNVDRSCFMIDSKKNKKEKHKPDYNSQAYLFKENFLMDNEFAPIINIPEKCKPTLQLPDPGLLDYYRDEEHRTIWLLNEVGTNCYDFMSAIMRYNREDEGKPIDQREPIKIIIDNNGGDLDIARSFCSMIDLSETPVYTYGMGTVASAASLIFACGHKRYAMKNTVFILHNGSCDNVSGTFNQLISMFENYQREVGEMHKFYAEHTDYSEEELADRLENDWYITVDEAIEHKLVDEVITDISCFFQ